MTTEEALVRRANISALCRYNFFTSLAIGIVANTVLSDALLLRMGFRPEQFAYAKSAMFIAPAICYELLAGYLQAKNRDRLVCLWCYALRVAVALLLPAMALCTAKRPVLFWTAIFVFGLGYTLAAFANNSLSVLYRKIVPQEEFSKYSARFFLLLSMPGSLCALLAARLLDRCAHFSNRAFFLLVVALEAGTMLFEVPAIVNLCRLKTDGAARPYRPSLRDNLAPILDAGYRKVLWMKILYGFLIGFLMSFLTIYYLKVARFSMFWFMLATVSMSFISMGLSVCCGKFMDRQGYRVWLAGLALVTLAVGLVFAAWPTLLVAQLLFLCLLGGDGQSGLVGTLMGFMVNTAVGKFAPKASAASYVAAGNLVGNLAVFFACIAAGGWYHFLEGHLATCGQPVVFRVYFLSCNIFPVIILALLWHSHNWEAES